MKSLDCDVLVIGAGFAGAAASVALRRVGLSVVILEARDRVGGRAYSRPFNGEDTLEFGGSWITPWQDRIRRQADGNGVTLRPRHEISQRLYHDGIRLHGAEPASGKARAAFDASLRSVATDALRYRHGDRSKSAMTLDQYLTSIGASPEASSQILAWWTISGNGPTARVSAAEFLASCAYGNGRPEGMLDKLCHTLEPGSSVLVERMIARSGARLELSAAVTTLRHDDSLVVAKLADGRDFSARHAVCRVPLNTLGAISFNPPLPARKAEAARIRHLGSSLKLWIKAKGVAPGVIATGGGNGLRWMFSERIASDGATLVVGFGLVGDSFDPQNRDDVAQNLARFFPEAELVSWDWHDWVGDPWSRGTWVALPAEALWIADSALWSAEGRIHFAGSDIAADNPGWFEAAIASGEAAADAIVELNEP